MIIHNLKGKTIVETPNGNCEAEIHIPLSKLNTTFVNGKHNVKFEMLRENESTTLYTVTVMDHAKL